MVDSVLLISKNCLDLVPLKNIRIDCIGGGAGGCVWGNWLNFGRLEGGIGSYWWRGPAVQEYAAALLT